MIIKLTGIYDDEIGTHAAKRVEGTNLNTGEPWDRKIFANAKDLREQLDAFGIGDNVNVKMEKNGKYWNVKGFEAASDALVEKAKEGKGGAPSSNGGGYTKSSGSTGGSKSTWNGRTGEAYDRSSSIYLAMDLLKHNKGLEAKKGDKVIDLSEMIITADMIFDYIHDGINPFDKVEEKTLDDLTKDI
jgi:hypothetical protein